MASVDNISSDDKSPDSRRVNDFHRNSDVDADSKSQHHTLGINPYQASPGDHNHDGNNSVALFAGISIEGMTDTEKINSIIQALVAKGAQNATG